MGSKEGISGGYRIFFRKVPQNRDNRGGGGAGDLGQQGRRTTATPLKSVTWDCIILLSAHMQGRIEDISERTDAPPPEFAPAVSDRAALRKREVGIFQFRIPYL